MATIAEALCLAGQYRQAGQVRQAEGLYRQIVHADPGNADAFFHLATVCIELGQREEAIRCLRRALALQPQQPTAHNQLGILLAQQGDLQEAAAHFEQALRLNPNYADAWNNLGNTRFGRGSYREAEETYQQALRCDPNSALAHSNLGNALKEQGRLEEAVASYQEAIRLQPGFADAYANLGATLIEQGRLTDAAICHERALLLRPNSAEAHGCLGLTYQIMGRLTEAIDHYQRGLRLPGHPHVHARIHNSLGVILEFQAQVPQAMTHFHEALRLRPDFAEAHSNLGVALEHLGRNAEAMTCYEEALRIKPTFAKAHSNWLFALNYEASATPEQLFREHCRWAELHAAHLDRYPAPDAPPSPGKRLRIGYVSPDLHEHPVARFLEPVLLAHDHEQFEVFCFADVIAPDATGHRLRSCTDAWFCTVGWTDERLARRIYEENIDILVDLSGHTSNHRLLAFARKPAPIQVSYLGYPNTTGLDTIDYRLTDMVADPPGEPKCHSEELFYLPGAFCCYAPAENALEVSPLPAKRLGYVTFGSPHKLAKLNPAVIDLWCKLLQAMPSARLLVAYHLLSGETKDYFLRRFTERGISAARLELRQAVATEHGYSALYHDIDILLDSFPWSGHTMACESLWMGVPVVTLRGSRHAGRMAASILTCVGVPELIAESPQDYLERAVNLASDLDRLGELRANLRQQMRASPLCDGPTFTRGLEAAYRSMWHRSGREASALY